MPFNCLENILSSLKLHGMLTKLIEYRSSLPEKELTHEQWLLMLAESEQSSRAVRSINYQLGAAKFPKHQNLDHFDFSQSKVSKEKIQFLHQGDFINTNRNIILVGGTGTGKTHMAIAIASNVIKLGKKARFFNAVDLKLE